MLFDINKDYKTDYRYYAPSITGVKVRLRPESKLPIKMRGIKTIMTKMRLYYIDCILTINGLSLNKIKKCIKGNDPRLTLVAYDLSGKGIQHIEHKKIALDYLFNKTDLNVLSRPVVLTNEGYLKAIGEEGKEVDTNELPMTIKLNQLRNGGYKYVNFLHPDTGEIFTHKL